VYRTMHPTLKLYNKTLSESEITISVRLAVSKRVVRKNNNLKTLLSVIFKKI